jgi:hypothetical protein
MGGDHQPQSLRELIIYNADNPGDENRDRIWNAVLTGRLFVTVKGLPPSIGRGERVLAPAGSEMRSTRLPNGMVLARASAVPPRDLAADETVAMMTGLELLQMVMKTPLDGLLVAAEDDRDSWTAMTREGIASILNSLDRQ